MEIIKVSREIMIEHLSGSELSHLEQFFEDEVEDIILNGYKGLNQYTNEELMKAYREWVSEDPDYPVIIELEEVCKV